MKSSLKRTLIKGMLLWAFANGFFLYSRHQETGQIGFQDLRVVGVSLLFALVIFGLLVLWVRRSNSTK